ncbi:MAG: hypothetical protein ACTSYS_06355, partial [Promethearchaeota archaeon]
KVPAPVAPKVPAPKTSAPSLKAVGLFSTFDEEIAEAMSDDLDIDSFLEEGLDLDLSEIETKGGKVSGAITPGAVEAKPTKPAKPLLTKSISELIPTKVLKKSEEELRKEQEELEKKMASDANLIYMRLLAFETAAQGNKKYKISEFSKILKDLEPDVIINFIKALDNDFIIDYDEKKKLVLINDPSPPELEIISREFEKWLRFGRL